MKLKNQTSRISNLLSSPSKVLKRWPTEMALTCKQGTARGCSQVFKMKSFGVFQTFSVVVASNLWSILVCFNLFGLLRPFYVLLDPILSFNDFKSLDCLGVFWVSQPSFHYNHVIFKSFGSTQFLSGLMNRER